MMNNIIEQLKEVAPIWAAKLQRRNGKSLTKKMEDDIHDFPTCVVGELWGFDDRYWTNDDCVLCQSYAVEFADIFDDGVNLEEEYTVRKLNAFIEHVKLSHQELINK